MLGGKGAGLRLGYAAGPVNVTLAFSSTNYATGDVKTTNIGGQYDFGVAKVMAHYNRDRVSAPANVTQTGYLIGGLIPMGAGEIRLAYSRSKNNAAVSARTNKYAIGYVHNLSKRTAVYLTYNQIRNDRNSYADYTGGAYTSNIGVGGAGADPRAIALGVIHNF